MHIEQAFKNLAIGFGGGAISGEGKGYGFGPISENESITLLNKARERGIKVFDTAPIYGFGTSEIRMGKAFAKCREEVFIVSKGGITWDQNKRVDLDNSPRVITKMLEDSLKNLSTDYLDIYMIHWPDPRTDIRRPMEVLSRFKEKGMIKHIGLCNTNMEDLNKAQEIEKIEVLQSEFNLFNTSTKTDILEKLNEPVYFIGWGTLDKGIISGRVTPDRDFESSDARSWAPWWKKSDKNQKMKKMKKVLSYLKESGHTGLEMALGFNKANKISLSLIGMRNPDQLDSVFKALENLPDQKIIDKAVSLL
ncbi:MAG: aldo/keto reductase [Deltaproteobacteria bacterium]|nr:MAG: aldo/keto reductase [Deltaproteobacteria bacterium]